MYGRFIKYPVCFQLWSSKNVWSEEERKKRANKSPGANIGLQQHPPWVSRGWDLKRVTLGQSTGLTTIAVFRRLCTKEATIAKQSYFSTKAIDLFCLIDVLMELCQIFQLSDKFKSTNSRHDLQDSRERMTANHRKLVWLILVIPKIGQSQYRTGI